MAECSRGASLPEEVEVPEHSALENEGNLCAKEVGDAIDAENGSKPTKRKRPEKEQAGVVYLARVPPGLDIGIVRSLLGRCGPLGRVWLRAEASETLAARRKLGGRRRAGFSDGWVEFKRVRDAESVVALLNGQPIIGATRRGKFQNDLWCLRFLPGFAWDDLVDESCGTRRERVLRVKSEVAAARREKAFVEKRADLARTMLREDRRWGADEAPNAEPGLEADVDADTGVMRNGAGSAHGLAKREIVRRFRQKVPLDGKDGRGTDEELRALRAIEREDEDVSEASFLEKQARDADAIDMDLVAKLFKRRRKE
jgi:ESF2/ABP1 family protein